MGEMLPTEPGWYWWRLTEEHRWQPVEVVLHYDTLKFIRPYRFDYYNVGDIGEFGPCIPSGAELAALQRDAARFRKVEAAATAVVVADKPLWYLQPMARTGTFGEAADSLGEGDGDG